MERPAGNAVGSGICLRHEVCGQEFYGKAVDYPEEMGKAGAEALLLSALDEIAWLLNIRK